MSAAEPAIEQTASIDSQQLISLTSLQVFIGERLVGTLALTQDGLLAWQYATSWLAEGFSISPRSLPLADEVYVPKWQPFEGIWGVFNDSLPDGWGRLLVDRMLRRHGLAPEQVGLLPRLAIVGNNGMGALTYRPSLDWGKAHQSTASDLDYLASQCAALLAPERSEQLDALGLDKLFKAGGSSGGARPKAFVRIDGEDWIVKFPASMDAPDVGQMEFDYHQAAQACGIDVPRACLFPSASNQGYYGCQRFDRGNGGRSTTYRRHVATASGLLEASHRYPSLDYQTLLRFTLNLTGSYSEVEKLYRLACFNVLARNHDDHAKNFSFIYDEASDKWALAPAYDLTLSTGLAGEHAMMVNGKGRDITVDDLVAMGSEAGLGQAKARQIVAYTAQVTGDMLSSYLL